MNKTGTHCAYKTGNACHPVLYQQLNIQVIHLSSIKIINYAMAWQKRQF